ncbi:glucose-1-phosphate cytidylyltransferase [Acidovorax sp.]|uniref:glucose-1-phosphate cytidylyltransferase n=1 Tax=Acidovorax sp. TaxID=1872122 RepID=UPI00391F00C3
MKAIILAGGKGTRLSEETTAKPKPMVEVGGMPIIWHIMKIYAAHGVNEFIVCLGYKGYQIKEWFINQRLHLSDITVDLRDGGIEIHRQVGEPWKVTLVETGEDTLTATRVRRVANYLDPHEDFCLTYGDGVADIDIRALLAFHRAQGREATVTVVQPPGRFGSVDLNGDDVRGFVEKPIGDGGWINAGFFVLSPKALARIPAKDCMWEAEPVESLAHNGQLAAFRHAGFWQPMDTLRDKTRLEELWSANSAPWKTWN